MCKCTEVTQRLPAKLSIYSCDGADIRESNALPTFCASHKN